MHSALYDWILFQLLVWFHTDLTDEAELARYIEGFILIPFLCLELRHYKVSNRRLAPLDFRHFYYVRVNSKYCRNASEISAIKTDKDFLGTGLDF